MRNKIGILAILVILFNFQSVKMALSDEIDDMTNALNASLTIKDWKKFGDLVTEYASKSVRFEGFDHSSMGRQASETIKSVETYGKHVDYEVVKRMDCGNTISRSINIFYSE